jgi:hypothetical protein
MTRTNKYRSSLWATALLLLVGTVTGCGSGGKARVSGKVTVNGKPVTAGLISFTPVASGQKEPGKPAAGEVQQDGSFTLGTESKADGAVPGKHTVRYTPPTMSYPEGKTPRPGEAPPRSGFEGLMPKSQDVEVKLGANTVEIELVGGGR